MPAVSNSMDPTALLQALVRACKEGDSSRVRTLALDPRFKDKIDINGNAHRLWGTPLTAAAACGHLDVVKMLLKNRSVDPNQTDGFGRTAVDHAMKMNHKEIEKVLVADERTKMSTITSAMHGLGGIKHAVKLEVKEEEEDEPALDWPVSKCNSSSFPEKEECQQFIVEFEFQNSSLSDEQMNSVLLNLDFRV